MYTVGESLGTRMKEEYDSNNKLVTKYEWERPFFTGVNLAWLDYGKDVGISHFTYTALGYSTKREELDSKMRALAGSTVRVFTLNDLRSGLNIDSNGNIIGFDSQSVADLKELLSAAEANGVSLILTLFDFTLVDGTSQAVYMKNGQLVTEPLGEFPQFMNDPVKRKQLATAVRDLLMAASVSDYKSVVMFDVMNEPEWTRNANRVSYTNMRYFVSDIKNMLHTYFPNKLVTTGSKDRINMLINWADIVDAFQFHFYDWMSANNGLNISFPAHQLGLPTGSVIFAGELEPNSFVNKLTTLYNNGYEGGLFWQDGGGYTITPNELETIKNWFYGTTYEYYGSGKLKSKTMPKPDSGGNIEYVYYDEDYQGRSYGRLWKAIRPDGSYDLYAEYWPNTETVKVKEVYDSKGVLLHRYEYDQNGNLITGGQSSFAGLFSTNTLVGTQFSQDGTSGIYGQLVGSYGTATAGDLK